MDPKHVTIWSLKRLYYLGANNCSPWWIVWAWQFKHYILAHLKIHVTELSLSCLLGAPKGKRVIIFIDDLNMPKLDTYGSQPPIELLRQYQDFGGFYDRDTMLWKEIEVCFLFMVTVEMKAWILGERVLQHLYSPQTKPSALAWSCSPDGGQSLRATYVWLKKIWSPPPRVHRCNQTRPLNSEVWYRPLERHSPRPHYVVRDGD